MFYMHVDVFSKIPFSGNSLSVFFLQEMIATDKMQKITEEMRHFESIFLYPSNNLHNEYRARIFTLQEELDFAGHPLIGAACAVHDYYHQNNDSTAIKFKLNTRDIEICTQRYSTYYSATMDQGIPQFVSQVGNRQIDAFVRAFNLTLNDLANFPLEVISTGLNYLIVPLKSGIEKVKHDNIEHLLSTINAKFVYFYDINKKIGRTWDIDGKVEDAATGSAIGPVGAYLVKHGLARFDEPILINQGTFLNRPSELNVLVSGTGSEHTHLEIKQVNVSGDACIIGSGTITAKI